MRASGLDVEAGAKIDGPIAVEAAVDPVGCNDAAKEDVERTANEDALNEFGGGTALNEEVVERTAEEDALNEFGGGTALNEEGRTEEGRTEEGRNVTEELLTRRCPLARRHTIASLSPSPPRKLVTFSFPPRSVPALTTSQLAAPASESTRSGGEGWGRTSC